MKPPKAVYPCPVCGCEVEIEEPDDVEAECDNCGQRLELDPDISEAGRDRSKLVVAEPDPNERDTCPQCNGSGEGMHEGTKCSRCHGSGCLPNDFDRAREDEEEGRREMAEDMRYEIERDKRKEMA